jgi:MoaA/NifB/PqqE/SkfB family radical SAM enzyme
VKKLLDDIKKTDFPGSRVYMISFNGLGEPLLSPHLIESIRYAKKSFPFVGFVTNGYRLDHKMTEDLLSVGVDYISVSLNAVDPKVYSEFQGYGLKDPGRAMNTVIENIKYFLQRRDELGLKTEVRIPYCITKASKTHLKEFTDYWRKTGRELIIHTIRLLEFEEAGKNVRYTRCEHLTENFLVFANGDVGFCCCNHTRAGIIGNIYKDELKTLFEGEEYRKIVEDNNKGDFSHLPPACRICENHRTDGFMGDHSMGYKFIYLNNPLKQVKWTLYTYGWLLLAELKRYRLTWPLFRKLKDLVYRIEYGKAKNRR